MIQEIPVGIDVQRISIIFFVLDNAWIESEAMNMHDETGELTKDLKLEAGNYSSIERKIEKKRFG